MDPQPTVFIVDDDPAMRESLRWLIESVGLAVETYGAARDFLDSYDPTRSGCLVLDVRMPGLSGLDLQTELTKQHIRIPTIIITGYAEVPMAVRALKEGAIDFIEKPFSDQHLLDRIRQAIEADRQARLVSAAQDDIATRYERLTPRERQVMALVVEGQSNKSIALDFRLSDKTVEVHRAKVMEKMRARSLAELIKMHLMLNGDKGKP